MRQSRFTVVVLALALVGCQRTLYDWGTYEQSVLALYSSHEDFSAAQEVDRLQREIETTERRRRVIPPAKLAHLGYLYLLVGDSERARTCFEREKNQYQEGRHFMDFLITRLDQ